MSAEQRFYPRIRTALFPADGGLNQKTQYIRIGLMLPTQNNKTPKLYINSVLRDRDTPAKPDESLSIRLAETTAIKTGFVGFLLSIRERNKHVPDTEKITKEDLHKRIDAAWEGKFDAQVHVYGFRR